MGHISWTFDESIGAYARSGRGGKRQNVGRTKNRKNACRQKRASSCRICGRSDAATSKDAICLSCWMLAFTVR